MAQWLSICSIPSTQIRDLTTFRASSSSDSWTLTSSGTCTHVQISTNT